MNIKSLNSLRTNYLITLIILTIIFTLCIYSINYIYPKVNSNNQNNQNKDFNEKQNQNLSEKSEDKEKEKIKYEKLRKYGRFLIPFGTLLSFFISCVIVAKLIAIGSSDLLDTPRDQYSGILFLTLIGIILTIMNFTVLKERSIKEYVKGKKFSVMGVFMALGVSAIVFGFLDNFGMKLGTEALDDTFVQLFLGPFSTHKKFEKYKTEIQENLSILNKWSNSKWKSVINQILRNKEEIREFVKQKNKRSLNDLMKDIDEFIEEGAIPLIIPKDLSTSKNTIQGGGVREFIRNVKQKYKLIDGSKSMMGNTFSDFIGAILGAAVINLFTYMTSYDGVDSGDEKVENSFLLRNLNKLGPFMEAFFISLGCLIPIFLNVAINRDSNSNNNNKAWMVVGVIGIIMIFMMYMSVSGIKNMTENDKKKSISNTLDSLSDRLDIEENSTLKVKINNFIESINN